MDSEDDIRPLIEDDEDTSFRDIRLNLTRQKIHLDPELEEVVHGYRLSRWRRNLVYVFSTLLAGLPFLVFHWCPTWLLYLTSLRCHFAAADTVLVIETYQKKCKSFYIHRILEKELEDSSKGQLNAAYQEDPGERKDPIDDDLQTSIHLDDGTRIRTNRYRYFLHKKCVLIWEAARAQWVALAGVERGASCAELHALGAMRANDAMRARMLNIYGLNEIQVPVQSILTLVLLEVFNPFYVFQVFTIAVWLAEPYYYYCVAVVLMSTFGVATSVIQTRRNQENLRATVESRSTVQLLVNGSPVDVDSSQVAPGDVLVLPPGGCRLGCDAALLAGAAVVNEAMLTGESVPVSKTALPKHNKLYDPKEHAANTLYSGTEVIQTRYFNGEPVTAVVLRTGYHTTKGQLVRSILYPIPADFKFDRDSYKFIGILAGIAVAGLGYTIALKAYRHLTPGDIAIKALDIITIVIPPALPAAMTVGRLYAVNRLQRARVQCLNTRAVNVSGSLDCICFDKTGTLTEDGLDMWGVVPCSSTSGHPSLGRPQRAPHNMNDLDPLKLAMASCHSLQRHKRELAGDPLDLKMFESTGWTLEEPDVPEENNFGVLAPTVVKPGRHTNIDVDNFHVPLELGIILQNQFVSELARASVVTRVLGEDVCRVFCKGAPEVLRPLCRPDTVPDNLNEVLSSYAELGYRVIAMTTRVLEVGFTQLQKMTREELECDLEFLGLVILENRLKPATAPVIKELKDAGIHVVMITGDNIHTAVSVAKECGILEPHERAVTLSVEWRDKTPAIYCQSSIKGVPIGGRRPLRRGGSMDSGHASGESAAQDPEIGLGEADYKVLMTGDTWKVLRSHYAELSGRVAARGAVFARMSADQKQQLVVEYQALGYYVGMCGDGANDCGALRAAHTGISLSELESSVAAPFTSQDPDIICVTRVLREGRAALTTSFGVFKFMIAYSLTEFFSVAFLYYFDSNLTDFQFLYIDIALIVNFAFFFGKTDAYRGKLYHVPPLTSLLALSPLISLIGQLGLIMVGQYLSYYAISQFPWYERHTYLGEEENECYENYAIFAVSMFQYIIMAIVFSHGAPYRRSVITNKQLIISIIIMTGICVYIAVAPAAWLARFLQLQMPLDVLMAYIVLAIVSVQLLVALFYERFIVQFLIEERQFVPKFLKERKIRKTPHLMIKRLLTNRDYLDVDDVLSYETEGVSDSSTSSKGR